MPRTLALLSAGILTAATPVALHSFRADPPPAAALIAATDAFLDGLSDAQRDAATFEFTVAERKTWHFVPGIYPGITLAKLNVTQRRALHKVLATTLSSAGYHKATTIMGLEDVLRELAEARGRKAPHRDPGRYSLAVFGQPHAKNPWGFRLQGHHISLNVSVLDGKIAATTPTFFGANPGEVRNGVYAGLRALPDEEDHGFAMLHSLTKEQRQTAILTDKAPADVLFGPGKKMSVLGKRRGVFGKDMNAEQRRALQTLIDTYLDNCRAPIAAYHRRKIGNLDSVAFAWMGATRRGKGHYYRVHGTSFAIEYDNTQNGANHPHVVFHDFANDFGAGALEQHYRRSHRRKIR